MTARRIGERRIRADAFRAASVERWKDAECLHRGGRFQGAIYLCGYALECELKSLVCAARGGSIERGQARKLGHDLLPILDAAGLREQLFGIKDLWSAFQEMSPQWSVEMRYSGRAGNSRDSERFLKGCQALIVWLRTGSKS